VVCVKKFRLVCVGISGRCFRVISYLRRCFPYRGIETFEVPGDAFLSEINKSAVMGTEVGLVNLANRKRKRNGVRNRRNDSFETPSLCAELTDLSSELLELYLQNTYNTKLQ
jgi:hypothetical protein